MDHTDVKREPLLSGKEIADMAAAYADAYEDPTLVLLYDLECAYAKGADDVAAYFNQKIASGELMVAKATSDIGDKALYFHCRECGSAALNGDDDVWKFCPNCGSKIIE